MFGRPVQRRDGAAGGLHSSFIQLKLAAAAIVAVVAGPTASAATAAAAELSSMSSNELLMDLLLLAAAGCCTPVRTRPPHPVLCTAVIHTSDSHLHPPTPNPNPLIPTHPNLLQHNRRSDRSGVAYT